MDRSTESAKEDRRITRTKNYMRNAILDLITERGEYNSIQINAIADKADVARSTFYLHYADKEELLYDALDGEFNKFLTEIQNYYEKPQAPLHLLSLLSYVRDHPRYFQVVLNSVGTSQAFEQTRKVFEEWLLNWLDFSVFDSSLPHHLVSYHISSTVINTIKWWLETENDHSPEEMERFCLELIFGGVLKVIGVSPKAELDEIFAQQIREKTQ